MPSPILCLGAINLDLKFQVDDLEGFLQDWGTGLTRGGEEAVSREAEARLTALLARDGRPVGRFGGGMAANTAYALACLGLPVGLVGRVGADADGEFLRRVSPGWTCRTWSLMGRAAGPHLDRPERRAHHPGGAQYQ